MLLCTSFFERQADVRLRRIYKGKHPTRSALFDGIRWPLGLLHHARRALPLGTLGGTAGVLVRWMVLPVLLSVVMVALLSVSQFPAFFSSVPTLVATFDGSDGSLDSEHEEESVEVRLPLALMPSRFNRCVHGPTLQGADLMAFGRGVTAQTTPSPVPANVSTMFRKPVVVLRLNASQSQRMFSPATLCGGAAGVEPCKLPGCGSRDSAMRDLRRRR